MCWSNHFFFRIEWISRDLLTVFSPLQKYFTPLWNEIYNRYQGIKKKHRWKKRSRLNWQFNTKSGHLGRRIVYFLDQYRPSFRDYFFDTCSRKKIVTSRIHLWCSFLFLEMEFMMFLHSWRQSGGEILNILICYVSIFHMWYPKYLNSQRFYFQIFHFQCWQDW